MNRRTGRAAAWITAMCLAQGAFTHATDGQGMATEDQSKSPIVAALQPFIDRRELAGAVTLIATKAGVMDLQAVGWADVAAKRKMRPDTMFWIASQTKPITATALMMLVEQGKIRLDEPIETYLPEFKGQMVLAESDEQHQLLKKPATPVTVRMVLSHTSGLPFASPLETPVLDAYPLEARVRSYAMLPLRAEPGTKYQYSNEGINIAGRLIEVASGVSYEAFVQQHLFEPLGMKDTTFWPDAGQLDRLATSYKADPAKTGLEATRIGQLYYPLDDRTRRFPMPAGGLFSTAGDVARFCQMILNDGELDGTRYLSADSIRAMADKQTGSLPQGYGLGFSTGRPDHDWFGHAGAFNTNMTIDRDRGTVLIWLVQHADYPGKGSDAQEAFNQAAATIVEQTRREDR